MDNTTTIEAGALTLEITTVPFEPVTAYRLLAEIGKVLVPTVLAAKNLRGESDALDLMPAVKALFETLTPDFAVESMQHVLAGTSVIRRDGDQAAEKIDLLSTKAINRAFKGAGIKPMMLALKHALEVNFGSFFAGSAGAASTSVAMTASA